MGVGGLLSQIGRIDPYNLLLFHAIKFNVYGGLPLDAADVKGRSRELEGCWGCPLWHERRSTRDGGEIYTVGVCVPAFFIPDWLQPLL